MSNRMRSGSRNTQATGIHNVSGVEEKNKVPGMWLDYMKYIDSVTEEHCQQKQERNMHLCAQHCLQRHYTRTPTCSAFYTCSVACCSVLPLLHCLLKAVVVVAQRLLLIWGLTCPLMAVARVLWL